MLQEMHLKCKCPHCGTKIRYQVELSSGFAHCPRCKTQFQLPDAPPGIPRTAGRSPLEERSAGGQAGRVGAGLGRRGALSLAFSDPMNSQPAAMKAMGKEAMLTWGFLMWMAFPVTGWLAFWRGTNVLSGHLFGGILGPAGSPGPGAPGSAKVSDHIAVAAELSVFALLLLGVLVTLNILHGRRVIVRGVLFTTGLALLPFVGLALYFSAVSFVNHKSPEVDEALGHLTMLLTLLSLSSFFLLLFSAVTRVIGFSRKVGFWLVPGALIAIFVLFTWITKFTGEISQKGGKKGAIIPLQIEFSEPGINRPQDPESTKPREIGPVANPIRRS